MDDIIINAVPIDQLSGISFTLRQRYMEENPEENLRVKNSHARCALLYYLHCTTSTSLLLTLAPSMPCLSQSLVAAILLKTLPGGSNVPRLWKGCLERGLASRRSR